MLREAARPIRRALRGSWRRLRGTLPAGRGFTVLPDDSMLVSYPRSGNTWVRFLLANLVSDEPVTFANLELAIPDIYRNTDRDLLAVPRPRILKSHERFDVRYPRVAYLVRDPLDVALSYYHYSLKVRTIPNGFPMDRFVDDFIAGEVGSFGSWAENVTGWLEAREGEENFFLLRYEDLLEGTVAHLDALGSFLDLPGGSGRIGRAVERSETGRMQRLEKSESALWASTSRSRQDLPFVRGATAGRGRSELPPSSVDAIESAWPTLLRRFGYLEPGSIGS